MKSKLCLLSLLALTSCLKSYAQIYSFEDQRVPQHWSIDKGKMQVAADKYKLGKHALKIAWEPGAQFLMPSPQGIDKAAKSRNGGITAWIYNTRPVEAPMVFSFCDASGKVVAQLPFSLNFTGWRTLWSQFQADLNVPAGTRLKDVRLTFPEGKTGGEIYLDFVEFTPKVSWQKMSDAQYTVNHKDFSLIPDFIGYRKAPEQVDRVIASTDQDIARISDRLTRWYLGERTASDWSRVREEAEKGFIGKGLKQAAEIKVKYTAGHVPVGEPLYPMCAPSVIDGQKIRMFRNVNEKMLLPLALDYRKNGNRESLEKAKFIYDWFNDQGWADGSGMGTLCFEKLRSSGYFHSFFLLKDYLEPEVYQRELNAFNWFTLFGLCYQLPQHAGEVADNLRALAIPKLIYALSLTDPEKRQVAMTAYKQYMDNALGIAPGFFGTLKADFSGYHHRGPYNSAYYPHALYAGALVAYLLHDTPYALSEETLDNLKQGLLTFRFFSANLEVPAGTVGRFPKSQQVLETLLPAFAYVAFSYDTPDRELAAAFKRIINRPENAQAINDYLKDVNSNLAYTSTVGEAELMDKLARTEGAEEPALKGALFMPYSGLLVEKDERVHFNVKGFSRYIWDFESSNSENLKGRYLAYGQIEYFDLKNGRKSFHPEQERFNWNHISGTTVKVLPDDKLIDKGGSSSGHRNFSDETFLAGVDGSEKCALFSFRMHDISYDLTFRANKSVFAFKDYLFCLGSDIQNKDEVYPTVTTLFQAFEGKVREQQGKQGTILNDPSFLYVVKEGKVVLDKEDEYACAYIDHGKAPQAAGYQYYIVKSRDMKQAKKLLSGKEGIEVISADNEAHIIRNAAENVVCGALFKADKAFQDLCVKQVNVPLAYVLEEKEEGMDLFICEPDMRRISRAHMGLLIEEDVIQEEKPFDTQITLNGIYEVSCPQKSVKVTHDAQKNETYVVISTIRGENYHLSIKK